MVKNSKRISKYNTDGALKHFSQFESPYDIQLFLNGIKYNPCLDTASPKKVLLNRQANCFEGALFASAALRGLGYKPLIVDFMTQNDDDHVIAIFKRGNLFGAVAKSNTTLLRYREPVYRTLRELVMSYFDFYFNIYGEKSLRSYSNPVDLSRFDKYNWMMTDEDLGFIGDYLYEVKHHDLVDKKIIRTLHYADKDVVDVCFSGAIDEGLFKPKKRKLKDSN